MKTLVKFIILSLVFGCKPTTQPIQEISGKYIFGSYRYKEDKKNLLFSRGNYDSLTLKLFSNGKFQYDYHIRSVSDVISLVHIETSKGERSINNSQVVLNSKNNKLQLELNNEPSFKDDEMFILFYYDFYYFFPWLSIENGGDEERIKHDMLKSFQFYLCEENNACSKLTDKNTKIIQKLSVKDSIKELMTYERSVSLNNILPDKNYYFKIDINKNNLQAYTKNRINLNSISTDFFRLNKNSTFNEIKLHLPQEELLFYPIENKKVRINKKNELIFDRKKLKKIEDD